MSVTPKELGVVNGTDRYGRRQGPPRKATVGANVTGTEKEGIDSALAQAGFRNEAEGVRVVLFAFRDTAAVRDAVATYQRQQAA